MFATVRYLSACDDGRVDDLAAFLNARLDEDEAAARAAGGRSWRQPDPERTPGWVEDDSDSIDRIVVYDEGAPTAGQAAHIARHDPARVLREVEAMRTMLRWFTGPASGEPLFLLVAATVEDAGSGNGTVLRGAWVLRQLAAIWSGHPDYRPEWKP